MYILILRVRNIYIKVKVSFKSREKCYDDQVLKMNVTRYLVLLKSTFYSNKFIISKRQQIDFIGYLLTCRFLLTIYRIWMTLVGVIMAIDGA